MPAPSSPPWTPGSGGSGTRRLRYGGGADYRASDAERADIADRLSRHYSDGRLDQAEFNERLDRAMNAKNRSDFHGLFADLPDLPDPAAQSGQKAQKNQKNGDPYGQPGGFPARFGPRACGRSAASQVLYIAAVVVLTIVVAHTLAHAIAPWLLLVILAFVLLRYDRRHRRW